jgi:hypothetical protein
MNQVTELVPWVFEPKTQILNQIHTENPSNGATDEMYAEVASSTLNP